MFWNRFVELCAKKGTTPTAVVKNLKMSASGVTKWKNGSVPNPTTIIKIAEYFDVSPEYLSGNTKLTEITTEMTFYKKLETLCRSKGITVTALASELGFSNSAGTTWKKAKGLPRNSTLKKISAYFGVPVEYFSDGEQEQAEIQDEKTLTPQEEAILSLFDQLDVIEQAQLIAFAVELKTRANEKP